MKTESHQMVQSRIRAQLSTNLFGGFRQHILKSKEIINAEKKRSIRSEDIEVNESAQFAWNNETNDGVSETITRANNMRKQNKLVSQMMNVSTQIAKELQFSEKFKLGNTIGEGAHAVVKKAKNQNGDTVAVKICRSGDPEIIKTFIDTYRIARLLNHPSILKFFEIYVDEQTEQLQLIMEYCKYPSLEKVLKQQKQLNEETVKNLMKQILEAVCHMNERGVAHRDLKPDNILLDQDSDETQIKIIDFGVSAKFMTYHSSYAQLSLKNKDMWTRTGNYLYCAPEIFEGVGYTEGIDIWACGVIMYQCLFGRLPFHEDSIFSTIEAIIQAQFTLPKNVISQLGKDLLFRLLQSDPKKRVSPQESLQHPWFYITTKISTQEKGGSQTQIFIRSLKQLEHQEDDDPERKNSSYFDHNKYTRSNTIHDFRRKKNFSIKIPLNKIKETTPSPVKEQSLNDILEIGVDQGNEPQECQSPLMKMSILKKKINQEIHIVKKPTQTFGNDFVQSSWAKNLQLVQGEITSLNDTK